LSNTPTSSPYSQDRGERQFERLTTFSDGVVAVAITLLVLPLIDSLNQSSSEGGKKIIQENIPMLIAFFFTFTIVALMWTLHNKVFGVLKRYDATIFWLNALFLALIALLPWVSALDIVPSAVGTDNAGWQPLASLVYWSTLGSVQLAISLIALHVAKHPELLAHPKERLTKVNLIRGFGFTAAFYAVGVLSYVFTDIGPYLPLLLIPASVLIGHWSSRYDPEKHKSK
jgi:uncharacterized membrane protein